MKRRKRKKSARKKFKKYSRVINYYKIVVAVKHESTRSLNNTLCTMKKHMNKNKNKKVSNMTWVAITPWSECSQKCGGGKSYLQRICILPKNSNSTCTGERVLSKDCNMQPCDTIEERGMEMIPGITSFKGHNRIIIFKTDCKNVTSITQTFTI